MHTVLPTSARAGSSHGAADDLPPDDDSTKAHNAGVKKRRCLEKKVSSGSVYPYTEAIYKKFPLAPKYEAEEIRTPGNLEDIVFLRCQKEAYL